MPVESMRPAPSRDSSSASPLAALAEQEARLDEVADLIASGRSPWRLLAVALRIGLRGRCGGSLRRAPDVCEASAVPAVPARRRRTSRARPASTGCRRTRGCRGSRSRARRAHFSTSRSTNSGIEVACRIDVGAATCGRARTPPRRSAGTPGSRARDRAASAAWRCRSGSMSFTLCAQDVLLDEPLELQARRDARGKLDQAVVEEREAPSTAFAMPTRSPCEERM